MLLEEFSPEQRAAVEHEVERLRFSRNYEKLRPYAPYCEETITLEDS